MTDCIQATTDNRLWGNSKLLGLVEACLKGEKVDVADTWRVGLMAVILISLPDVVNQSTHYGDRLSVSVIMAGLTIAKAPQRLERSVLTSQALLYDH